jgi:hypothetical protein
MNRFVLFLSFIVGLSTGLPAQGSLCTDFNANHGFAGNMFDIFPRVEFKIDAIDVNVDGPGLQVDVDVWYIPGTSVGNEGSAAGWTLMGSYSGTSAGFNLPSLIDMRGNGVVFQAGQSYGIYVDVTSYANGTGINYTTGDRQGNASGNDEWSNSDLRIVANCAKGAGGHTGSTFTPRNWNGCIYYDAGSGGGFTLDVANLQSGAHADVSTSGSTPGTTVIVAFSLTGSGPTQTNVGMADLSAPIYRRPAQLSDAAGNTNAQYFIPAGASGQAIWLQAVNVTSKGAGLFLNQVASTIL